MTREELKQLKRSLSQMLESLCGPRQLPKNAGEMPIAGRNAANATSDAETREDVEDVVAVTEMIGFSAGSVELVR